MRPVSRGAWRTCVCAAALAAGCGNVSNEDLRFLAMLPDDTLSLETPEAAGQALYGSVSQALEPQGVQALERGRDAAGQINAGLREVLQPVAELARHVAPSERGGNRRVWGPLRAKAGGFVRLVMTRDEADADAFAWRVELSRLRAGPWDRVVDGRVRGADFELSSGLVRFDYDVARLHGRVLSPSDPHSVTVGWTRTEAEHALRVSVEAREKRDGTLAGGLEFVYRRRPDGGGSFAFALLVDPPGPSDLQERALLMRWLPTGEGRADFRVRGDSLPRPILGSACWDATRATTYAQDDAPDFFPRVGDPYACPEPFRTRGELPW